MTRYHGGQGRMSGKGRKLPRGFLKRLFPGKDKGSVLDGDPACARVETRSGMT